MPLLPATPDDAEEILVLQRLAYRSEAEIYDDHTLPPLTQTLEEMRADFETQVILKAVADGEIVGSVRACLRDGTCHIGRLIVHPDHQGRGLGKRMMAAIEEHFQEAERFELFTGHRSERNLHLYRGLGYRVFAERPVSEKVTLVFMEKRAQSPAT
ncbi:GNAT family N-acetyltransferase [Candidatus Sumerlaeota bacterium]|nr:GNAT family N-acetyltransferase [Candidatus Sumerlaeota bacterium]